MNVIKYLITQEFRDVEYIFINHGFLDKNIDILNRYGDERIKIINTQNTGLSTARNIGVKFARGEYIL